MAFFGADSLEHQIKQLKAVAAQKDSQLTTLLNEQHKKQELFDENKRAKDDALYRVQAEADRADKAEKALALKTAELSNTVMKLLNAESTINANNERAKKDEKEIERLQYELDSRLQDSSTSQSRVKEAHSALQAKIKSLESQLQRLEAEKESLKVDASFADRNAAFRGHIAGGEREKDTISGLERLVADLRQENIKLIEASRNNTTATASSSPVRVLRSSEVSKRRRRSLSFNGDSRIQQLQDEVETLKDQLSRGADYAEVDKLKENLASIKKKSLKLENEKMALERSTKKAIEEMESRLEANTEELEYLRRNGGDETSQELEKLKKTAQKEKAALEGRIASLKEELSSKTDSLARIEKRLEVMEDELREAQNSLVGAQDAEARAVEELEKLSQRPPAENKDAQKSLDIAQEKVAALEADMFTAQRRLDTMAEELAQAKAAAGLNRSTNTVPESAVSTSVAHLERTIRQLQREVSGLTREKAALQTSLQENDDLLAEKDEEIFALKTSIPIPPSPSATRSLDDSVVDHANLLAALETKTNELVSLRHEKAELQEKLRLQADQMAELTQRVYALQAELEVMQSDNAEALQQSRAEAERQLLAVQDELRTKSGQLSSLVAESAGREQEREAMQTIAARAFRLEEDKTQLEAKIQDLEIQLSALAETQAALEEARKELMTKSFTDKEVEAIRLQCTQLEAEATRLQQSVKDLEAEEFVARQGKEAASGRVSELEGSIKALEEQLVHDEEVYDKISSELKEEKANLDIALTAAKEELGSLRAQLQELQDTMADRSTATEAGEREMALLQAQSREEDSRATIRELQEEIESNHSIAKMAMESAGTADTKLKQELADLQFEHALSLETVESLQTTIADLECRMQKLTAESVEAGIIAQQLMDVEKMLSGASETEQTRVNEIEHHLLVIRELRQVVDEQNRMLEFAEVEYEILLESTQAEHRATTTTIKDLQERLENLTVLAESDQDEIKRAAELARHNIQQELDTVHANLSAMELSLKENTDSLQASEDRAAKLRSILQEREKEVQRLKASMAETGQPIDGVVLQLRQEVNDLEARIERRNRQIALEQEKARKLGMNLQLAQDTVEEQDAILQDTRQQVWVMEKAKVALQTQVESLESAGIALAVIVQQTAAEAAQSESDLKHNIAELQNQLREVGYCQNQLVLQLLIHRHCRASTSREAAAQVQRLTSELSLAVSTAQQLQTAHQDAMSSLEEKSMEQENVVATLQSQKVELDGELQALRIALSTITDAKQELEESAEASAREIAALTELHHQESASVQIEMETLRETTHDLERRLSEVETEKASLLCQIQMFETDITELRQQLEVATNELQQKHSAMKAMQEDGSEQNNTLAVELEEAKAELTRLRQQIQGLTTDLEAAEERYSVILKKSQENEAVLVMAKEAAEEEMTRRALERDVLRQEKDTLLNESAALSEAMDRLQQSTESSQQRMQQTIEREQQRREETEAQLSALTADVLNLQKSLDKAETLNQQLVRDVELAQAAMTSTESQKEEVRHEILVAEQHRVQLEARLSDLSHTITVLQQSKIALLQENESFRTELAANVGEIASLRVALGEQRREIDSLHNAKFDHSSQEETALEETREELGRERVLHEKRTSELEVALQELNAVKAELRANAELLQSLMMKQQDTARLLSESQQTVSALTRQRDELAAEIAELSDEKKDLNARLESMNNEMEEHMENVREAQKAKTSAQRKLEKLERKLKALAPSSAANVTVPEASSAALLAGNTTTPSAKAARQAHSPEAVAQIPAALSSGRKRARESDQAGVTTTPAAVFAPSPFERARSPIKVLPGGRTAFTPNRTPNRHLTTLAPTDENQLGGKPSVFTPKMRILSDPASYTKTTPSTLGEEKLATLRTKLADMRTHQNI